MKILMLTPYLPYPPASGGQIRTYNLLKHLCKTNEITLVCLYKKKEEMQYANQLRIFCKDIFLCKRAEKPWQISTILQAIFGRLPFLIVRNFSKEAAISVKRLLDTQTFDVIHAETFYVMPHIPETNTPILLVDQTLEYRVYKHFISKLPPYLYHPLRLDTYKLKYWEIFYWNHAQLVAAVSEADAQAIHSLDPKINPVIIPNGASDDMFVNATKKLNQNIHQLLFVGNFSWLQNTEAAEFIIHRILPILDSKLDKYLLTIAGQNIPKSISANINPRVRCIDLSGLDNQSVKDLYVEADIFVAPIFGPGGTRLKILTAMATCTPVITTKTGAEGLLLTDNESVLLAETPEEFVDKIMMLMNNEMMQKSLAKVAFQIAQSKFSWESITIKLIESYQSIVNKH